MSKKILLELTEKEVEIFKSAIIKEKYSWEEKKSTEIGKTVIEKNLEVCHSIWAKLDLALQPQQDVSITSKDFHHLISLAKGEYHNLNNNLHLSDKKVEENHYKYISLANALLMWLNGKDLLKKLVKFDYTDKSFEYEEMEE